MARVSVLLPSSAGPVLCPLTACKGSLPARRLALSYLNLFLYNAFTTRSPSTSSVLEWTVCEDRKSKIRHAKIRKGWKQIIYLDKDPFCRRNLQHIGDNEWCLHAIWDNSPHCSHHPVKSSPEVKGVTTPTLAVAAVKLFKGVNSLSYSGVRPVTERRSKSEMENTLC